MSSDSAVTYTSVHSEARSWSIPSEDPYRGGCLTVVGAGTTITSMPAEDEAPIEPYITEVASTPTPPLPPPSLLPTLYLKRSNKKRGENGTPPLLPIPLPAPSTSRRADIPKADTPPQKRLLLTAPTPRVEFVDTVDTRVRDTERRTMAAIEVVNLRVSYQADVRRRESLGFYSRHQEAQEDRAAVRAEIEILRRERLAYEQESIETRQALAESEISFYSRALEARIRVLETQAYRHEWQRHDADDHAIEHIIHTQALEARARIDTLEDTTRDANTNGVDSHNSRICARRNERATRECTYPDFMKFQPQNFKGTKGVVELTQWIEKMEILIIGNDIAYAMTWTELKKKITNNYCPRTEIKKLEVELWELKVKGTDVIGYNQRFQELALLCGKMFPEKADKIEKYVGGLPDMIYGSVVASKPKTMQEATEMEIENKRLNTGRAYTVGSGENKPYEGSKPLCSKCNYHHDGPCAPKYHKCNKVGHFARDCRSTENANNANHQRGTGSGQKPTCFECGVQGHFKRECPKLKNNNNHGNQVGGGNAPAKVYAVGHAGTNPYSNVMMGTFLLNNRYASVLFDTGADRSFVSTAFSS
ncbi:putative reverse transcriptase domain-containing protein [Tanacetum coccineum]